MKARREIENWPVVPAYPLDMDSAPEWLRAESERHTVQKGLDLGRAFDRYHFWWSYAPFVAMTLGPFVKTFSGSAELTIAFVTTNFLIFWVGQKFGMDRSAGRVFQRRKEQLAEELEARGEGVLGAEIVGVSYGEELWWMPGLTHDMDGGALRIDFDRLSFTGRHTCFELPARAILATEIRRTSPDSETETFRVFLDWRDGDRFGTLSLCVLGGSSPRQRATEALALRDRIEAWRSEPHPLLRQKPAVAPPRVDGLRRFLPPVERSARVAQTLALSFAGLVSFLGVGAICLIPPEIKGAKPGLIVACVMFMGPMIYKVALGWFEKRLPLRYRHQEPEVVEMLPPLGERVDEETATIQNRA